jgi:hypothetical protein
VFDDLLSITVLDTSQPAEEQRFVTLGGANEDDC